MKRYIWAVAAMLLSCQAEKNVQNEQKPVRLMTLDPGHFHAALVQKTMYKDVDSTVHVFAPEGPDVQLHLERIRGYNTREENPTAWNEVIYAGEDFFEKMIDEKPGNVVVLAGNNQKKTEYILQSLEAGVNVLADKPMAIDGEDFETLKKAFSVAEQNGLLLYDIMTERYEITTMLQREFSRIPEVFGTLEQGTPEDPAITKESVHHLYKYVSGNVLTRPPWFFDVLQEGEGIVDVMTHLVDLVMWECYPGEVIDYEKDIQLNAARRWATDLTLEQFAAITKVDSFPPYLQKDVVNDSILQIYCNGEINYRLRDVHAKTSVTWAYKAPAGGGDTHYSIMRGSKANLVIRQGAAQNYAPTLYIEPVDAADGFEQILIDQVKQLQEKYAGINVEKVEQGWKVVIPDALREGHEAHFARVTEKFLEYLREGNMPEWEVPNMIAKYYTTTQALKMAHQTSN